MFGRINLSLVIFFLMCAQFAFGVDISFPEEELATETVLPVFDHKQVVKNRQIVLAEKFELGIGAGLNMTEALYDNKNFNVSAAYHFDETHGFFLNYLKLSQGLSDMGAKLQRGEGLDSLAKFDASLAPAIDSMLIADYQVVAYYGKLSITKNFVMHLHLYGLLGAQYMLYTDGSSFGLNGGIGQKMYFSENFGLRMDLRFFGYMGLDPTSKNLDTAVDPNAGTYKYDDFEEQFYLNTYLTVNLILLI